MTRTKQAQGIIFKITKDNKINFLLVKRIKEKGGFWQHVSGGVEETDSTIKDALYRELYEEISLQKDDILNIYDSVYEFTMTKHYLTNEPIIPITEYSFGVKVKNDFIPSFDKNIYVEHEDYTWCNIDSALEKLKWSDNKKALKNLYKKIKNKKLK